MELKEKFGFNALIALTIATASCWRTKAHAQDIENSKDSIEVDSSKEKAFEVDSATVDFAALGDNYVSNHILTEKEADKQAKETEKRSLSVADKDSIFQAEIYQDIVDMQSDLIPFLSLSEKVKFIAYNDRKGKKMTIGNGLTKLSCGRPVRKGDYFFSEDEMIKENLYFLKNDVVPYIAKYFPNWKKFEKQEKLVVIDICYNNGAGLGVLTNEPSKDPYLRTLSDAQLQEIADKIKNNNQKIVFEGKTYSLNDLPEYRNLNIDERNAIGSIYANKNIVKGTDVNFAFGEKWALLTDEQRHEVVDTLKSKVKFKEFSGPNLPNRFAAQQVDDSTVIYRNFLFEMPYSYSETPQFYLLPEAKQIEVTKRLAAANNYLEYNGHRVAAKDIQAWYFLDAQEKKTVRKIFGGQSLMKKNAKNQLNPILSGLCCELNLYLVDKSPKNRERAAARIASFVRSHNEILLGLVKRANFRARLFSGEIPALNLREVILGSLSECAKKDVTNGKAFYDAIVNCKTGRNYEDTIKYEQNLVTKLKRGPQNRPMVQSKAKTRGGSRGR